MLETTLLTTLHDSSGWSIEAISETSKFLDECYNAKITILTTKTKKTVIDLLEDYGWNINIVKSEVGVSHISDSRKKLLEYGLEKNFSYFHLVDMDRLLHWAKVYPTELKIIAKSIPNHDFLVLGRTKRAFDTHPSNQRDTECLPNKVVSLICGQTLDVTAGSRGISRECAELIIKFARGKYFDSDSEWPIILLSNSKIISFLQVEGLEWETPIKRSFMNLKDGRTIEAKEYYEINPEAWAYRIRLCNRISQCAYQTYQRFNSGLTS